MSWTKRFVQGPLTRLAISQGHWLLRALGATWRIRFVDTRFASDSRRLGGPLLYVLPHGHLLPLVYAYRERNIQILVSESRDGEVLTRVASSLGIGAIRGSSSRGGDRAVVRMAAQAREGYDLAITPDGPRGPRGSVAPGTALVSARGNVPIIPLGVGCSSGWRLRSWDRFLIPHPFARIWVACGEAITPTPEEAREPEVIVRIQQALKEVGDRAQALADEAAPTVRFTRVPG